MAPRPLAALTFVILLLVPLIAQDYWVDQLTRYVLFGLFAMSLSLVWGRGGMLCFGQAMFFGGGGYIMATVTLGMWGEGLTDSLLGLMIALICAAAFAALLGYFLFWGKGLSGAYLAVVTLAIAYVLEQAVKSWYALGGDNGISGVPPITFAGFEFWQTSPRYYLILGVCIVVYALLDRLVRSPFGVMLTGVRTNPDRAMYLGFNVFTIRVTAFVIGAVIAALSGALFVAVDEFASPTLIGFALSTEVLIWVALGGREMPLAAFVAAILIRIVETYLSELFGAYWILALGGLLMVSVVMLPKGLLATPFALFQSRRKLNQQ